MPYATCSNQAASYLEANTTIPIPHIHAFGRGGAADEKNPTGYTYIVQSYIVGQPLNLVDFRLGGLPRREHFYSQLVDILAQLRQQEFPYAGSLMPDPHGGATPHVGPLLSIQLNDLQRDNPSLSIQPTKFATPLDYAYYQYRLLDESLRLLPEKLSQQVAELEVFALQDLKNRLPSIVENQHPFVLTHTDLRPTNIIVDENMQIQGIIDWEWARTVPRQFFLPPTWIAGCPPDMVSGVEFRIEYRWLRDVLWADTSEHCRQLASEWNRKLPRRIDMSLAVIFGHHSSFVNAYYRGVFPMFYESSWGQEVKQFYECDGPDGRFSLDVQQRLRESKRYAQYLEKLGVRPASLAEESRQESGEPPLPDPGDA